MAESIDWADRDDLVAVDLEGVTEGLDGAVLDYWLGRARRAITAKVPARVLEGRIRDGTVDSEAPQDVQIDLVLGKLANPGGVRTVQESNGPSSGSITYGGDTPGQLALTSQHREMLGVTSASRRVARTVDTWR